MNKKELISALAEHTDSTQAAAGEFLNAFCETVVSEMKKGDGSTVAIPGFGQFIAKHRASREMRNPATGKMMMSKAKTSAQFKPSAGLKDL
jgi:nucleoid DNA-binding protein